MCAVIIQLRKPRDQVDSKNRLIAMLEDLLRDEDQNTKKNILKDKYGMQMTIELERRLANMCNLRDLIEERGIERGISAMIIENLEESTSKERIIEKLQKHFSLSYDKAETYFDKYTSSVNQ